MRNFQLAISNFQLQEAEPLRKFTRRFHRLCLRQLEIGNGKLEIEMRAITYRT